MMGPVRAALAASCLALSGCVAAATSNFAPPVISLTDRAGNPPTQTLDNGLAVLNLYIDTYRQKANRLSNGRQLFDVPAIVSGVGGATAMALGANADVAIGTGAFSALSAAGKGYYTPNERAAAYYDAVSALVCVQQEAIGLNIAPPKPERDATSSVVDKIRTMKNSGGTLTVSEDTRAYLLLRNGALKVENRLQQRLSSKGKLPDAEALAALVGQYQKKKEETANNLRAEENKGVPFDGNQSQLFQLRLEALAPKIDICVLKAG